MYKRVGRAAVVCLTLFALTGCGKKQNQQRPVGTVYAGAVERTISRELSKYGPQISRVIDTDYTDGKNAPLKLRKSDKTYRQLVLESGLPAVGSPSGGLSSAAMYDDLHKTIILLSPTHLKAFHHEFGLPWYENHLLSGTCLMLLCWK